jgi:Na+/melibiose symporter-like transporter
MATIPQQPSTGSDEEASGSADQQAPSSNKPSRKLRLDPKRKQLEDLRQATAAVATITSFKAMPPRFAASLGAFIIVVVSGVWISLLLATLEVDNWPSWVGAGITVVLIVVSVLWCYVRAKMGAQNNQEMVDQLQREFAYAVERSREEMAEETQMEMGHGHH